LKIFVTADLHLGHDNIRRHCKRPFDSVLEMDEALIANWNSVVSRNDLVYVVGDFAWKNPNKYLARLQGKKILIRGNHDRGSEEHLRNFAEAHDLLIRKIDGRKVVFCHYCMTSWPGSGRGAWHLYGHSHGVIRESANGPRCDVGVDVWNYAPAPWDAIQLKLGERKKEHSTDISDLERNAEENRRENRAIMARLKQITAGGASGAGP
jgi:calcineurin-like phosphoesterase family protein